MTLKGLVPPLELCKRIPAGEFGDSVAIRVRYSYHLEHKKISEIVVLRDELNMGPIPPTLCEIFAAQTLAEIMTAIDSMKGTYPFVESYDCNLWRVRAFVPGELLFECDNNPAAAALRLWLKLKGGGGMNILWFSAGVSSAMIAYLCRGELDKVIYQHIEDQEADTLRFLHDVENLIGREITIQRSPYCSVENVIRAKNIIRIPRAPAECTKILKQQERKRWEYENDGDHTYYWGLDINEKDRMNGFINAMPNAKHRFPLIERELSKDDVHGMAIEIGLRRPRMYEMGYHNNNCVGCVRGGMGYWNKIRVDFPEVFAARAKMERDIGHSCINGVYLDELDPDAGRHDPPISVECGVYCLLNL